MTRITMNEIDTTSTLSAEQQKTIQGGFGMYTPWGYIPYRAPISNPYAFGFGTVRNVFTPGSFGFGVQAGTAAMQASFTQQNNSWMSSFRSGW